MTKRHNHKARTPKDKPKQKSTRKQRRQRALVGKKIATQPSTRQSPSSNRASEVYGYTVWNTSTRKLEAYLHLDPIDEWPPAVRRLKDELGLEMPKFLGRR